MTPIELVCKHRDRARSMRIAAHHRGDRLACLSWGRLEAIYKRRSYAIGYGATAQTLRKLGAQQVEWTSKRKLPAGHIITATDVLAAQNEYMNHQRLRLQMQEWHWKPGFGDDGKRLYSLDIESLRGVQLGYLNEVANRSKQ